MRTKPGPKPQQPNAQPRRLADAAGTDGLPEPDGCLSARALGHFNRLLRQAGGHLKRADSCALSLLARQLDEEEGLAAALAATNPAIHPNEYLAMRRALTSLQGGAAGLLKGLGLTPKSRRAQVELEPPAPAASAAAKAGPLPFVNDSGLTNRRVSILSDVAWPSCQLDAAEADRQRRRAAKPSLTTLCHGMTLLALLDNQGAPEGWNDKQFRLACQIDRDKQSGGGQ